MSHGIELANKLISASVADCSPSVLEFEDYHWLVPEERVELLYALSQRCSVSESFGDWELRYHGGGDVDVSWIVVVQTEALE